MSAGVCNTSCSDKNIHCVISSFVATVDSLKVLGWRGHPLPLPLPLPQEPSAPGSIALGRIEVPSATVRIGSRDFVDPSIGIATLFSSHPSHRRRRLQALAS